MAGINVPQYSIFKIGTNKLKHSKWNINISKHDAFMLEELIDLFQAQEFRLIPKILNKPINEVDFSKYIMSIVVERKSDFARVTSNKGVVVNGITFRRFVGTTGGLKNNTLLFVNIEIIDELNRRCECERDKSIKLIPAKYEAYKALTCSASQEIISPEGILVVSDCFIKFKDSIISLDNSDPDRDSPTMEYLEDVELENNTSDGFNLCTIEFMEKISKSLGLDYITNGVCLRNAWLKGMLYAFPIIEFFDKYCNGNYIVVDIWGHEKDIRECEMILTESSLKLWKAYSSIEEYVDAYKRNGYEFAVTKISPKELDDQRELNYQYLQSYDFTDEDIEELCSPTVKYLKDSLCGDYESTMKFLGITGDEKAHTWQKALGISEYMLKDPYVIDSVHRMIKKKIDGAKIGKLIVDGNYQIASGDPFALMQHICGLEVTGLLKADECYSSYWRNKNVDDLVIFRSPMTSHNNIRKCKCINNEDVNYWYQYMDNIMIINGWDTFCMAENGCDYDSDILFSTNNPVLLRRHKKLPAISCAQSNAEKIIVTEEEIKKTNKNGMGNEVGVVTNRVTAMMEKQSHFKKGTKEYEELEYRIACGQLYQQDVIDKIKGIIARPMPSYWYTPKACGDDEFLRSICIDKKPYFMTYVYNDYRREYRKYIKKSNINCKRDYGCSIEELYNIEDRTEEQNKFLYWYEIKMPFGMGNCAMNKICYYIEEQFNGYVIKLKNNNDFNYENLKIKRRCTEVHRKELLKLCDDFEAIAANYRKNIFGNRFERTNKSDRIHRKKTMENYFRNKSKEICPNDNERLNIVLDMCYKYKCNKTFCWDIIGDLICKRLEELNEKKSNIE